MARKCVDLTGQRFGRWLVKSFFGTDKHGGALWSCLCDCGNTSTVPYGNLMYGKSKSCGCLSIELLRERHITHGMYQSPTYFIYIGAKGRCENSNSTNYDRYGGRGIRFLWESFEQFYKDMGDRPEGMTLERQDVDGHYCKENCYWADYIVQARNKRNSIIITHNGVSKHIREWAEDYGISPATVNRRHRQENTTDISVLCRPVSIKWRDTLIEYGGVTQSVRDWCKDLGLNENTVRTRFYSGDTNPDVLLRPLDRKRKE